MQREIMQRIAPQKQETGIPKIKDVDLAEALMRPQPYTFNLVRDPFLPIVSGGGSGEDARSINSSEDLKLKGTVMVGKDYCALIQSPIKTAVFKTGETIADYTIERIESKRVVLRKQDKVFILKIEGEKANE